MNKYQTANKSKLETNLCSAIHRTHKLTNVKERHPARCRVYECERACMCAYITEINCRL